MNQTINQIVKEYVESLEGNYVAKDYSQEAKEKARAKYGRVA
jgi:hypothetical protein